jgi:hypothetical protein
MKFIARRSRLWRVLYANKEEGKLVLYAEMKLLDRREFKIINNTLYQAATFKPRGIWEIILVLCITFSWIHF